MHSMIKDIEESKRNIAKGSED